MLKERAKILKVFMIIFDAGIVAAAYFVMDFIRGFGHPAEQLWLLPVLLVLWVFMLYSAGMYKSFRTREISDLFYIIFKSAFFSLLIASGVIFFFRIPGSRNFMALVFILATALISLEKILLVEVFRFLRKKGLNSRSILIIGSNKRAEKFIDIINEKTEWGYRIVGIIDEDKAKVGQVINGVKIIGSFDNITDVLHNNVVDEAVFIVPRSWLEKIEDILSIFEIEGIPVSIAADFFDLKLAKAKPSELQGFPLLTFSTTTDKYWQLFIKRTLDAVVSFVLLIIFFPFFIVIALVIKLTSPGPVLFRQMRSGLNGRKFMFYKFRTMIKGAEEQLKTLKAQNEMEGPVFKMKNDPRVTPVGRFLRRTSLDEVPQLWNVLIGNMSLVGPRPPLPDEVNRYDNWHRRRLSMRPGMTCLWQVKGRNNIVKFDDWMKLDLEYIDNWWLGLDFQILLLTVPVVIFGIGAK